MTSPKTVPIQDLRRQQPAGFNGLKHPGLPQEGTKRAVGGGRWDTHKKATSTSRPPRMLLITRIANMRSARSRFSDRSLCVQRPRRLVATAQPHITPFLFAAHYRAEREDVSI